ncbi:3-carboxy-cis,cis-muconate cycloisomerase [Arthrobacter livingstonensis]|uniref:3-carboxy-cis,cis-muconate cycloisomerase n=1 Tax=Arthrobacter livingstonensis TaxID=670078 RepID=A0A2V5LAA1_9MICC|nr:3-carboxy-cis,cis-muconate cycloisomerase [Arthrobacter livingstonensis]
MPGDFGLLSPVTADPRRQSVTGDGAVVAAVLAVETAWVQVLESTGLAPAGSAATIREAANGEGFQAAGLAAAAQGGGNPVIPIVAKLRSLVSGRSPEAAAAVHASLTSQDVLDTALMLLASNAVAMLRGDVAGASAAMARLARAHAGTLQPARTLTQHSLPSTFGLKAAQWFHGLAAAATRLDAITFPVQFGGAAGTLAAGTVLAAKAGTDPFTLADSLAGNLGLAAAPAPWHTNRTQVTALGDALAALTDAAGKVANDVLLLSRPEFGELAEPRAAGRGVSSAMPQKQNPVLSILVRSAALAAPQQAAQLHLAAALSVDERPDGAWHTEWNALRTLLELAGGAAAALHELAAGLQVFPDAMRRNLAISGPLLLSEAAGAAVVPLLESQGGTANPRKGGVGNAPGGGKAAFQAIVDRALQAQAGTQGTEFARLLRAAVPETALADAELDRLLDPAGYLGENSRIVERIFAAYPQWVPEGGGHE